MDSLLVIIARRGSVGLQVPPLMGRRARLALSFHPLPMPSPEGPAPRAVGGGENRQGGLANLGQRREARAVVLKFRGLDQVS